jgi:hypothetical protein
MVRSWSYDADTYFTSVKNSKRVSYQKCFRKSESVSIVLILYAELKTMLAQPTNELWRWPPTVHGKYVSIYVSGWNTQGISCQNILVACV